ncbi:alpha/beta hydrolase [Hansschlegelia zhihuaiae]|uniref:Alpha/beta hydrolase n=1 Tax=Hansschlegelia zhihuaiae TaxID=405005 RepID=A0A4Q0MHC0_9HYPH|nr:alpha/beta hydrolase [Hansschlegelia zhihuaiae]RXF72824.1 alpha/beta hydrolase [Hansschlegelia zhihuaiae]
MSLGSNRARAPQEVWETLSQAERDAAYNNNAAVRNSAELIAARDAAADAFRAAHAEKLDLPYGPKPRQKIDLYPAASPSAPCLAFIHGGYWQRNSREQFAHYAEGALAAGWSVALIGYSLAPDATLTDIVAEIGEAFDWLAREGPQHGVAGPIVCSGWSAGGQLAAMALNHSAVAAGLAISGVYDIGPIRETFLNDVLKLGDDEVATLSPLKLPIVQKPLAVAYGTAEVPALIHDSRALHAMRAAEGALGPLIPIEGADHFTILEELRAPTGRLVVAAQAVLAEAQKNGSVA